MLPGGPGFGGKFGRDGFLADSFAVGAVKVNCLAGNEIDNALKFVLVSDGQLHQNGVAAEFCTQLFDYLVRIGACAVHFVDECQARDMIASHLPVDGERLCLDSADGTKHQDCPVEHAKAAFHLDGEIDVARSIDQIDHGIAPLDCRGRAGDGYAAFLFQFHVVHGCPAAVAVDFLHAVDPAGVEQDPLGKRSLAGVDMGRNAYIA